MRSSRSRSESSSLVYTSHANSTKERTPNDVKFRWERTAGLHGQLTPRGFDGRSQYEATSPWGILPRSKANAHDIADHSNHEIDMLNLSNSAPKSNSQTPVSEQPTPTANNEEESATRNEEQPVAWTLEAELSHKRDIELSEECTFTGTTAATRRQSLKDLFRQYDSDGPAGFLSSKSVANGTPRNLIASINCHICAWTNGPHTACWRCRHLLCQQCDFRSPQEAENGDARTVHTECIPDLELPNLQQEIPKHDLHEVLKQDDREQKSTRQSAQREFQNQETLTFTNLKQARERSSRSENSPFLSPRDPAFHCGAQNGSSACAKLPDHPRTSTRPTTGSRAPDTIQDPYSVFAEMLSTSSLKLLPVAMQVSGRHSRHHGHRNRHKRRNLYRGNSHTRSSSGAKPDECASSGCRATHAGHRPYRHSISCLQKRQTCLYEAVPTPFVNQKCYADRADASLKQSKAKPSQLPQSSNLVHEQYGQARHCDAQLVSSSSTYERHGRNDKEHAPRCSACNCSKGNSEGGWEDGKQTDSSMKTTSCPSNYAECHGYPRTSHTPSRSPIAAGIVGECQHCLTDCQCAACQSTHHNVRCCVHKDHHPLTHHHYMPQKETANPVVPVILALKPASIPKRLSHHPALDSVQYERSTVAAPMPRRRMTSPQWMSGAQDKSEGRQVASLKPQGIPTEPEKGFMPESAVTEPPPIGKMDPSTTYKNSNHEPDSHTTQGTSLAASSPTTQPSIAYSDYLSGGKATVSSPGQSLVSPHSQHELSQGTRRLSELFKRESAELSSNKVQGHQQGLEGSEGESSGIRTVIPDEVSCRMDMISELGLTGNVQSEERILTLACEHRRSRQQRDRKSKNTNYFIVNRKRCQVKGVSDEKMPSLHPSPPLISDIATEATKARHMDKPLQGKHRSGMIDQSDNIMLQQQSSPKVVSEEVSGRFVDGIKGITVAIHLEGREDMVVKTDLVQSKESLET
jgi:hypothetical protein